MATKTFFPVSAAVILLTGLAGTSIGALAVGRVGASSSGASVGASIANYEATIASQSTTIANMALASGPNTVAATATPQPDAKSILVDAATPMPVAANDANVVTDVAAGAPSQAIANIDVPALVEAVEGKMPIQPIGYGLTTERRGDGWVYGKVLLAFRNVTTQLGFGAQLSVAAHVETKEGQTYPAVVEKANRQTVRYDAAASKLDLTTALGVPPGLAYLRVGSLGGALGEPYAVYFRFSESTHPTRIVFADMPDWEIDLSASNTHTFDFPAFSKSAKPMSVAALRGRVIAELPGKAEVAFDGTCDISAGYFYIIHLNYTVRGTNQLEGARLAGTMPSVAFVPAGNGALMYQRRPASFSFEVGPGEATKSALTINTRIIASSSFFPPNEPPLLVLYDTQGNTSANYAVVSLDGCTINRNAMQ